MVKVIEARVRTRTGSVYLIRKRLLGWDLKADNVQNPYSVGLPNRWYPIQKPSPWPPKLGEMLVMFPPSHLVDGDPDRMPGGGKLTSPVVHTALTAVPPYGQRLLGRLAILTPFAAAALLLYPEREVLPYILLAIGLVGSLLLGPKFTKMLSEL